MSSVLERLDFKINQYSEVLASKVFERVDGTSISRAWIEIYKGERHYSMILGLTTRDIEDVVYLVEMLNNILEDYAKV
jgi:hypothetical protein